MACCNGSAVCKGGLWIFLDVPCGQACGGNCGPNDFSCQPGALCVTYIGPVTTYQCRVNPCFEGADCGCAGSYCAEQNMSCNNIQDGYKVLCD